MVVGVLCGQQPPNRLTDVARGLVETESWGQGETTVDSRLYRPPKVRGEDAFMLLQEFLQPLDQISSFRSVSLNIATRWLNL